MKDKIYLYPIWIRLWHLLNALLFLALIITGLSLQYSSQDFNLIEFQTAISIHNIAGIVLCVNYFFFIAGNRLTSNGMFYQFHIKGMLTRVMKQFHYYSIGIFKKEKAPYPINEKRKFNPLQKISYVLVMYMFLPVIIFSGLGLFFPEILPNNIIGINGIHFTDLLHIISGFVLSVFMVIHIYFCTFGKTPLSNFKSMINGWH